MKRLLLMSLICLIAWPVFAQPKKASSMVITIRGSLFTEGGKPVENARFNLWPKENQSTVELDDSGKFEMKAVASNSYYVDISADGYAPLRKTVDIDNNGTADLGKLQLDALRKIKLTAVVGPRGELGKAPEQVLELRNGACANVRAQDDSGCRVQLCIEQVGADVRMSRSYGNVRSLGKVSLKEAIANVPKGTIVSNYESMTPLNPGETLHSETGDPYCSGLIHVDEVK